MLKKYIFGLLIVVVGQLHAANLPDFPFVVATGEAEIEVAPDIATITINILSFDEKSKLALLNVELASKAIINIMKKYNIDIKKLEASDIRKSTTRKKDEGYKSLEILGYEVNRSLYIHLDELTQYSEIMAALVATDFISRVGTDFDISNRQEIKNKLLNQAGKDARSRAAILSNSLDSKIVSIYAISQASTFDSFFATFGASSYDNRSYAMKMRSPSNQIQMFIPEYISITQNVNVVFRIKGK